MGNGKSKIDPILFLCIIWLLMFVYVFITGCALAPAVDVQKQAEQTYRKDMKVTVDKVDYIGVGVLPLQQSYKITLYPKEKISRLIVQSCNRELVIDKPKSGWFSNDYSFVYTPLPGVETGKLCQLEIAALNENTRNSFAFFEFDDSREEINLQGFLRCNGAYSVSRAGVSICQAAEGLEQQIFFQEVVLIGDIPKGCNEPESNDGVFWSFVPNRNKCSYYFVSNLRAKNKKRRAHRLTTLGYSSIPYPME